MKHLSARSLLISPIAIAILAAFPAVAQTTGGSDPQVITVTATKRDTRITNVPLAVSAIGESEIRDRGAVDLRDLQYSVPVSYTHLTLPTNREV